MDARYKKVLPYFLKYHIETNMSENEVLDFHRWYNSESGASDTDYYENEDDFFELFFENNPAEAVRAVLYGDYRWNDEYVWINGCGNVESSNYILDKIDIDAIIDWIMDDDHFDEVIDDAMEFLNLEFDRFYRYLDEFLMLFYEPYEDDLENQILGKEFEWELKDYYDGLTNYIAFDELPNEEIEPHVYEYVKSFSNKEDAGKELDRISVVMFERAINNYKKDH